MVRPQREVAQEIARGEAWLGAYQIGQEAVLPDGVVPGIDEVKPVAKPGHS